ncbi:thiamine/thiamine pyrophosphate ABC transporter permease ThiP [Falsihalocynthiibacter sp. BN13B15]|uniref:thiamine/thiamine pyrophosphate ABC transporter permease ThiP n=1 Tax=Falsihalocynthiibacter sp. BN13B15 TaxID=3240871 RepID=UPI00350F0141
MASLSVKIKRQRGIGFWVGAAVAALILFLCFGTVGIVAWRAEAGSTINEADISALAFTVKQALLSAFFSVILAIPVARALARRSFVGRRVLITLLGAPFVLPVIVAVLGLLAVFGRSGIVSWFLGQFGIAPIHIYGLHGVVLAHVFFNLPLAVRLILQGWLAIPSEQFRLAASLGCNARDRRRLLEYPMLAEVVPGAFAIIFLICTTSFAVALAIGGGPKSTTVELAIYHAFRFDFDLSKAALLALLQVALSGCAALLAWRLARAASVGGGFDRVVNHYATGGSHVGDSVWLLLTSLFLGLPLAMIVIDGVPRIISLPLSVWQAAGRSLLVSMATTGLTVLFGLSLAFWVTRLRGTARGLGEAIGYLTVAVSPLVMGAGLFIVIFEFASPQEWALPITALVNSIVALPFAMRVFLPAVEACDARFGALAQSLDLKGFARFRLLEAPRLARPIGFVAGLAAALSMGDLGVVALFADPARATLPLALYDLMGAYRMADAAGAALLLMLLSLGVFYLFDRGGRTDAPL